MGLNEYPGSGFIKTRAKAARAAAAYRACPFNSYWQKWVVGCEYRLTLRWSCVWSGTWAEALEPP